MRHIGTVTIETERLRLRRFSVEDAQAMFQNWASSPQVTKFLRWPPHENLSITKEVVASWVAQYVHQDFYQWAIEFKESCEPVGSIGVVEHNEEIEMVHIGYCIGEAWWHQGITSEALRALVVFFMEEVNVLRVESMHDPQNPNSGFVMRKAGLHYEGTLHQRDYNNQGLVDCEMYAILASDY